MSIFIQDYTEEGFREIPPVFLTEEEYEKALRTFVFLCTDILIVDTEKKLFYLAQRKHKPINHWWFIGGRMNATETKEESAIRCFKRETGLDIHKDDMQCVAVLDHRLKDREQHPQDVGCHTVSYVFTIPVQKVEIQAILLEKEEYHEGFHVEPFDRKRLVDYGVYRSMIDLYDKVFPAS